jgi:hypothetical protein
VSQRLINIPRPKGLSFAKSPGNVDARSSANMSIKASVELRQGDRLSTKLLHDAHRRPFDVVLVLSSDRLARSTKHFLEVLDELKGLGIRFVF